MSRSARVRQRLRLDRVPVRYMTEGWEAVGFLKNVSRAGIFVEGPELPRPGALVSVQFRSPTGRLVDARGEIRWTTEGLNDANVAPGFGVVLHEPPREYREFVAWVLEQAEPEKGDETPRL